MRNIQDLSLILSKQKRFKIIDKYGSLVPFKLNFFQRQLIQKILQKWIEGRQAKLIIIKPRQGGFTTLIQMVFLALCMKIPSYQAYTMTHRLKLANDVFEKKIKLAWDSLTPEFKSVYNVNADNARQLSFGGYLKGSSVTVGTSARGQTYNALHISEPGKASEEPKLWKEIIQGTLPAGEKADLIIFESTADGGQGGFYNFTMENYNGEGDYEVLFFPWFEVPEYAKQLNFSKKWLQEYKQFANDYELYPDPVTQFNLSQEQFYWYYLQVKAFRDGVKSQYPFTLEEAFSVETDNYFRLSTINKREQENQKIEVEYTLTGDDVKIYLSTEGSNQYVIGVDTSTGESKDEGAICVIKLSTGETVATWKGLQQEDSLAQRIVGIAEYYNQAYIVIESNFTGRSVIKYVMETGYPRDKIFRMDRWKSKRKSKPKFAYQPHYGWETTKDSRYELLSDFRKDFESGYLTIYCNDILGQMKTIINHKGKYEAVLPNHDDLLFASMVAWQGVLYYREI